MSRLFGTNGVRGIVNEDLTVDLAVRLGKAIGKFFGKTIAIASDTRNSGSMIKSAVSSGLMSSGADVIDLGTVPTPALQYYARSRDDIAGGVMITASHNPPQFNGIKCVGPTGQELSRDAEERIEALYHKGTEGAEWHSVGTMDNDATAAESYVEAIVKSVDAGAVRNANMTAVLDCANGAAFFTAPLLLEELGVRAITLNANPQGDFPGHPSEPTEDNLKDLISLMRSTNADIGIAHDGDADRTVFIANGGEYVSGDKSLSLMAKYMLSKEKGLTVTPVSSSSMVGDVVREAGGKIMYTAVGSPVVARAMFENKAIFGGEENGGMIFPKHQLCRDGAMTVAMMLECIVRDGPLSEQIRTLPEYHTEKRKIDCPNDLKDPLLNHLKDISKNIKTDTTDGLKLLYGDGWVLARPSGTEPKFRIFSESKNKKVAVQRADETERKASEFIKGALKKST
jgi:phosphomannomutase/phosphoglucomutase